MTGYPAICDKEVAQTQVVEWVVIGVVNSRTLEYLGSGRIRTTRVVPGTGETVLVEGAFPDLVSSFGRSLSRSEMVYWHGVLAQLVEET